MVGLIPETISPYKIVYYSCRCAGIMKNDGKPWSLLVTIYHILSVITLGLTSFLEICLNQGNLQNTIEALSVFAIYIQLQYKVINMLLLEKDFRNLLDRLETFRLELLKDENNRKYVKKAEIISRKIIFVFIVSFVFIIPIFPFTFTTVAAIIDVKQRRLILAIWIPWQMEKFPAYLAGNILATLVYISGCIIYVSIGIIQITFTFQISAYLQVLENYLETKGTDRTVYRYHLLCIQFINDYNDIISGPLYLEILLSSIMPCGFAFSLIKAVKKNSVQLDIILPTTASLAAPSFLCHFGQIISNKVEKLHESSYMSHWYEEKPKIRRNLLTLMTMTTKPTVPNYRKLFRFDHVCLASVFQGLYSFFMMVINFDTD